MATFNSLPQAFGVWRGEREGLGETGWSALEHRARERVLEREQERERERERLRLRHRGGFIQVYACVCKCV